MDITFNQSKNYYIESVILIIFLSVTVCFCVGYCIARRYNV